MTTDISTNALEDLLSANLKCERLFFLNNSVSLYLSGHETDEERLLKDARAIYGDERADVMAKYFESKKAFEAMRRDFSAEALRRSKESTENFLKDKLGEPKNGMYTIPCNGRNGRYTCERIVASVTIHSSRDDVIHGSLLIKDRGTEPWLFQCDDANGLVATPY